MATEAVVLDPSEVAVSRTELDITFWMTPDGPDWGTAEITAYMAEQARGESPVDYRVPNRTVTIPLILKNQPGGLTFDQIRDQLQSKVARLQQEGGWLKRHVEDIGASVYLDVVNASLALGGDWLQARRDLDLHAALTLECIPDFYGDEITLGDHVETSAAEIVFTETTVVGNYPGRVRLVVDDDQGVDQRGLIWSIRSRNLVTGTSGSVAFEAEAMQPMDTATKVAKAGASGGTVVTHGTLATSWTPVLGTNLGGTTWLTHTGSNRVLARVYSPQGTAVEARFVYDVGDFNVPVENDPVRVYDGGTAAAGVATGGTFSVLDLGQVRLDKTTGTHRWQGQIQGRGLSGGESLSVDRLWVVNTDDGFGVLRAPFNNFGNLGSFSARSDFTLESGNITGDSMQVGGSWIGAGGTVDFTRADQASTPGDTSSAFRSVTNDTLITNGRYATASSPTLTNTVVQAQAYHSTTQFSTAIFRYGVVARYTDANNWVMYVLEQSGDTFGGFQVLKRQGGTVTTLAQSISSGGNLIWTGVWWGLRLVITASGFFATQFNVENSAWFNQLSGYDAALATGGALASGKVGIYDAKIDGTADSRFYRAFNAYVPPSDAVVFASQSAELSTSQLLREDSTGVAWTPITFPLGDLPRLPPATIDTRSAEVFVKMSRGDFQTLSDPAIDDLSVRAFYRPCYLFFGEP